MDFGNLCGYKVLIIDDERDLLNLLETYLIKEGFKRVYKAETGTRGIEYAEGKIRILSSWM